MEEDYTKIKLRKRGKREGKQQKYAEEFLFQGLDLPLKNKTTFWNRRNFA